MVALTGDYVTFSSSYIWPVARALGRIRAKQGIFAVLGNHDFRAGAEPLTRALRHQDIMVLRNANHPLPSPEGTVWFLGVDDPWAGGEDLAAALKGVPADEPKVLLCHNPTILASASRAGIDLVISGHTHGGQIQLPWVSPAYGRWRSRRGRRPIQSGLESPPGHSDLHQPGNRHGLGSSSLGLPSGDCLPASTPRPSGS